MARILLVILLLFIKANNSNDIDYIITNENNFTIFPGISRTFSISYLKKAKFKLDNPNNDLLQINIRSINCRIEIPEIIEEIKSINYEFYSILVYSNKGTISIVPRKDIISGFDIEPYDLKQCFLSINSHIISNENQKTIEIENKEEKFLLFNNSIDNHIFYMSYNITKVTENNFTSLNFRFEDTPLKIDIFYTNNINKNNSKSKIIEHSTFIYLDNEFLSYNNTDYGGGILYINITNINKTKSTSLLFKIIEENNVCLLVKNTLNLGFITSKSPYQYYFSEILPSEGIELMLHNKRLSGVLYAKLIEKKYISNINDLYNNLSLYPHSKEEANSIYNEQNLQLKLKESDIDFFKAYYILITYEQIQSKEEFPVIGYEYTILSRTWNYSNSFSNLIDIPSNEYIIGYFEIPNLFQHYYSIHIPDDVGEIVVQIEGSNFEAYYGKDRKMIYPPSIIDRPKELIIYNTTKKVAIINRTVINSDYMSFICYHNESYYLSSSYYYFRVLFTKNNESKYLPIDSNLGNLCLPKFNGNISHSYCNLILKNNYNELNNINFAISTENQNEFFRIDISIIYKNKTQKTQKTHNYTNLYIYDKINENVDYFLFTFEFKDNEIKNIISSFCDRIEKIYPHIYSSQMHYLNNFTKWIIVNSNNEYFLKYQFIFGESGVFNYSIEKYNHINVSNNFKGKSMMLLLDKNFSFYTNNSKHIFYYKLVNNLKSLTFEEVKSREHLIRILKEYYFPLYYFIKIKNKNRANMDVHIKFQIYMDYPKQPNTKLSITGYIINENKLKALKKGQDTILKDPIEGSYSDIFGIGLLEVDKPIDNSTENFLLIAINDLDRPDSYKDFVSSVEISFREYNEDNNDTVYILPVNRYIMESVYAKSNETRDVNKYCIYKSNEVKNPILIEISAENKEIDIKFDKDLNCSEKNENKKEKAFKKYLVKNDIFGEIKFNVTNKGTNKSNYLIKYSYYDINDEKTFIFDDENITKNYDNFRNFFIFNSLKVNTSSNLLKKKGIYFYITGTVYTTDKTSDSNYILNKKNSPFVNKTINFYNNNNSNNNWTLGFQSIPTIDDYSYDLQLQIHALLLDNFLNEEYLLYKKEGILKRTKQNNSQIYIYIFVPVGIIILGVALFFIIKFFKLKKKNEEFKQDVKSLLFSKEIQKNVLIKDKQLSKNESDFETTFI